jgi:UDP-N-acetylmuramoyl-tripeptide--D-alanyl-D-alanine ligase
MKGVDGQWVAAAAGAVVVSEGPAGPPGRAVIDSREAGEGDLFLGLPGETADGGEFAAAALEAGAWGVVVGAERAAGLPADRGWVLSASDPLVALGSLARSWRHELGARVVGITGSTGKTSVKDICAALLPGRLHASPENYNTEIGLPLAILGAEAGTEVVVLEMAMRGAGQIRELAEIAEPDVGVITNVGPVHVELLGSLEAIAAAKAELLGNLREGGTAVVPAEAGPLEPYLGEAQRVLRFGPGGDVEAREVEVAEGTTEATVVAPDGDQRFRFPFDEAHNLENALAAIAAGVGLGASLAEMAPRASRIVFSPLRGQIVRLPTGSILINDCYNANPLSMRAALDHLGSLPVEGRRLAVLGEMRELGPDAPRYHREIGEHARRSGVELIIGVGDLAGAFGPDTLVEDAPAAAEALAGELGGGDAVLVKGSRAVGLEVVAERLEKRAR